MVPIIIAVAVLATGTFADSPTEGWGNKFVSPSLLGSYSQGAVSANGKECAAIGAQILGKGGSAVDGAIGTLLCEGIASMHNMGLGGGFYMTIWDPVKKEAVFLNAREKAPAAATEDMFHGDSKLSFRGGKAVAVPGELLGYWEAHQRYGKLPWKDLFEPSIRLAEEGPIATQYLEDQLKAVEKDIHASPTMSEFLIDPKTNRTWKLGDRIKRPRLAAFLRTLSEQNDVSSFYGGDIGKKLVEEVKGFDGILSIEDLKNYNVKWDNPIVSDLGDLTLYTAPPPASGIILTFIMNVLKGLLPAPSEQVFWQRVIETFKWAYARRTELGDPDFVDEVALVDKLKSQEYANEIRAKIKDTETSNDPAFYGASVQQVDDHGTGNVAVLAPDGSAVSVTSTVNQVLGAMIASLSTGIIFNDQMDDFSAPGITNGFDLPPSPANFIRPGKRPLSSMAPSIFVDKQNKVRLVVGGAGGTRITTAVALTAIMNLWMGYNVKEAVDIKRVHHQLLPMAFSPEPGFNQTIRHQLEALGHKSDDKQRLGSGVTAIANENGHITANADWRREGSVAGVNPTDSITELIRSILNLFTNLYYKTISIIG